MKRTLILSIALALGETSSAQAAFEASAMGPRDMAMGGAFTAVYDDVIAAPYNPAILGQLNHDEFSTGYVRQYHIPAGESDQDTVHVAGAVPVRQEIINGTFGFWEQYTHKMETDINRNLALSYGSRNAYVFDNDSLDFGGSLRILHQSYDHSGPSKSGAALDMGVLYRYGERYAAGASLINWNRPNFGQPGGGHNRAPATLRLGVSESLRDFTIAADFSKSEPSGGYGPTNAIGAGLERWWATARAGSFAFRTGLSIGNRDKTWNWGTGWREFGAQVNYAMAVPMQGTTRFGHAVAISFRFGTASNPEGEYERILADEIRYRQDLARDLEAGEVRQWKLDTELKQQKNEIEELRRRLADKTLSEKEARGRLSALEERHRKSVAAFQKEQEEQKKLKEKTQAQLFSEDWDAYQKIKIDNAPDTVLLDRVRKILKQYKDAPGVDLSIPNQELLRLLRGQ